MKITNKKMGRFYCLRKLIPIFLVGATITVSIPEYSSANGVVNYVSNVHTDTAKPDYGDYESEEKCCKNKEIEKTTNDNEDVIVLCDNSKDYKKICNEFIEDIVNDYSEYDSADDSIITLSLSENDIRKLDKDTNIHVEKDVIVEANKYCKNETNENDIGKNDSNESVEWNMSMINVDDLQESLHTKNEMENINQTHEKVKVAVIDSGIDIGGDIPVYKSISFVPEDEGVDPMYYDITGHGTSVAGVIASTGEESGIKGVNSNVELYSLKVLDDNNVSPVSRIVEAIYWCIDNKINIINMSFGTSYYSATLNKAVKEAYDNNILMIASCGNGGDNHNLVEYPAAYDEVLSVGSVNSLGEISDFNELYDNVDVYAPGELINTTGYFGGNIIVSGTSYAVPHVTGVASLLWEKDISCSNEMIKELLIKGANSNIECDSSVKEEVSTAGVVDAAYSADIYDEFKECYEKDMSYVHLFGDNEELDTDDSVNYVEGRWSSSDHKGFSDSGANYSGVSTSSVKARIFKLGAAYPDKYKDDAWTLQGMKDNPQWHGVFFNTNYFACYIYATKLALAGGDKSIVGQVFSRYQNDYNMMSSKVNQYAICGRGWNTILSDFNYAGKSASVQKSYRKYFIYGMAMHIATDTFAHSSYDSYHRYLSHDGYNTQTAGLNYADDASMVPNRWKAAKAVANEVFLNMNSGLEGSLLDFMDNYTYYDGSFHLGNVMWYADGVGLSSYGQSNINRLYKVASGNYIDDASNLPGGISY